MPRSTYGATDSKRTEAALRAVRVRRSYTRDAGTSQRGSRGPSTGSEFCTETVLASLSDARDCRSRPGGRAVKFRVSGVGSEYDTCVVFILGYPGMGKRTVGACLAELLDGVLVDNQLINRPLLELFRWDGKESIPMEIWDRVVPIREAVLATIEDLAPKTNSYVFTNVLKDDAASAEHFASVRTLALRRGSLFLSVMLTCDIDVQISRIDNPDRVALRKGSDPEGYRWHRLNTRLHQPPANEVIHLDTTTTPPRSNAEAIHAALHERGYRPSRDATR